MIQMNGYEFTWLSAMKLLGGILLAVVWYMMRKQAMLDKKYREETRRPDKLMVPSLCRGLWSVRISLSLSLPCY